MKRLRFVATFGVLAMAFLITTRRSVAQADLPFAKAETVGMSSKRLERINAFIKDYIDTNQIAGAVTLVARKGTIVHFASQGWRYKEENQPMEKDAIFSLASMTKPIVSTALMMLIGILMIQINPFSHFNIRPLFSVAVAQAIVDSLADQKPRVMGYATPR